MNPKRIECYLLMAASLNEQAPFRMAVCLRLAEVRRRNDMIERTL